MAGTLAYKRLSRDFKRIQKEPIDHCTVIPDDDDFLIWYFLVELQDSPFEGCQVLAKLLFPKEYPMKAPDVVFLTPTGRFKINAKICMTNSGFHPEEWAPSWSIGSLIVSYISAFYEQQRGIGHLTDDATDRMKFARESRQYNQTYYPELMKRFE